MGNSKAGRAAKPKAASKPAKASKAKVKTRPAKPSPEQISDAEMQRKLLQAVKKVRPLILAETLAKSGLKKFYETCEKDGTPKKDILLAMKFEDEEGEQKQKGEVERILRISRVMGSKIAQQLDLFPKTSAADDAFNAGKRAALADEPARPPMELSDAAHQHWLRGFAEGREHLNKVRLEGFKPLGAVAGAVAGNGADAVDSLSEDDTEHQEAA